MAYANRPPLAPFRELDGRTKPISVENEHLTRFVPDVPLSDHVGQMLILRVVQRNSWQKDSTRPPLSTIRFSGGRGDTIGLDNLDGSEIIP